VQHHPTPGKYPSNWKGEVWKRRRMEGKSYRGRKKMELTMAIYICEYGN
jgi:hypothetical protein